MKTPEEIKKGLECCNPKYEDYRWKTCEPKCPYSADIGVECRIQLMADALAYIQQLERERDAAVAQLKEVDTRDLFSCSHCKGEEFSVCEFVDCENCDKDCPCATCVDMCNWQWRGAQEVE